MSEQSTPLMRQHADIKKQHPSALLFFRVGDFYELFFDDAVTAARELQITLTSRQKEKGIAIPMCGVPYHAAENYIARLIRKGYKVAICDQVEDPKLTKKLVRREVTRVVTPGTAVDSQLGSEENNFLTAVVRQHDVVGFAALDLSTGDFRATEFRDTSGSQADSDRRVQEELHTLRAREVLYPTALPLFRADPQRSVASDFRSPDGKVARWPDQGGAVSAAARTAPVSTLGIAETPLEDWVFAPDYAIPLVENHFGVLSLEGFGLAKHTAAACAAGAILHYIKQTQRGTLTHVDRIGYYERAHCLVLDSVTTRNLELVEPLLAGTSDDITLFRAIDHTCTPMGKRLLRAWMLRPSIDAAEINARLDAVEAAIRATIDREELRRSMEGILDIERLLSRVTLEAANPRDVLALAASFAKLPNVKIGAAKLANAVSPDRSQSAVEPAVAVRSQGDKVARWQGLSSSLDELTDLRERIETTILPEPPLTLSDGGVIANGLDKDLDELRDLSRNGKQFIAQIEQRERERTGINSLKIKFNNVFGFYIEISKSNLDRAPSDYERKQTLVGAERFTTPELKEYEQKVLSAEEKIVEIEKRIFGELRVAIAADARRIRQAALTLAEIDVLASFAYLAAIRNYCRPAFDATGDLEIVNGRHPVIEQPDLTGSNERFVPNDLYLNAASHNVLLITGPNMGGKSTYLRQTALIVLMAQMGSFVPATRARLTVVDRIFTRIGAADNLARGRSTFMVEMTETAAILNTATAQSLILLDEIGRGTATYDGLAIAWAVVEYIHARTKAKTLFATHYHELTELESLLTSVKNFHVSVKETGGNIVFLRKVEVGAADKSYGIEVAKLAGLPHDVIVRAREVLHEHESAEQRATEHLSGDSERERPMQLTIFTPLSNTIVDRLRDADLNNLTPIEALNLLHALKKQLD